MATFPIKIVRFFFFLKINKIETFNEIYILCKLHENPTKNVDFIS